MTTNAIRCSDCRARVPIGRLSCPGCGALLASVSSARERRASTPSRRSTAPATPAPKADDAALAAAALAAAEAALAAHAAATARLDATTTATVDAKTALDARSEARPVALLRSMLAGPVAADEPAAANDPVAADEPAAADDLGWDAPAEPAPEAAPPAPPEPVATEAPSGLEPLGVAATVGTDPPILTPRAYLTAPRGTADTWARETAAMQAGYRPSTLVLASATSAQANWPGVTTRGGTSDPGGARTETSDPQAADGARPFDAARFVEIGGWLVIVGSTLAILGFLLPWSRAVIGAGGYGAYFDAWGLAGPTHLFVFAGLLAVLALGVIRSPVPAWLATGVVGLVSGALLLGLVWPYLIGPLGAEVGVLAVALGGVALLVGGLLASWASRHDGTVPPV